MSTNSGFCDDRDIGGWGDEPMIKSEPNENESTLACLVSILSVNITNTIYVGRIPVLIIIADAHFSLFLLF